MKTINEISGHISSPKDCIHMTTRDFFLDSASKIIRIIGMQKQQAKCWHNRASGPYVIVKPHHEEDIFVITRG